MTINAKKLTEIHIHKVTLLAPDERFYIVPGARDYALSDYGRLYHLPSNHKVKEIHNKQGDAFWIRFDGDSKEKVVGVGRLICITFFKGRDYILKSKPGCKKEFRWKVTDLYILKNPEQLDEWTRAVKSHRIPKLPKSQCGSKFKNRADFTREDIAIMYWNMRSRATNPNTKESKPRYAETTIEKAMIDNPKLFEDWVLKNQYYYPSRLEVDKDLLAFGEKNCYDRRFMCLLPHHVNDFFRETTSPLGYSVRKEMKKGVVIYTAPTSTGRIKCDTYAEALEIGRKHRADKIRAMIERETELGYMPKKLLKIMMEWADRCEQGLISMWEPSSQIKENLL